MAKTLGTVIHQEFGQMDIRERPNGPDVLKVQVINYEGKSGPGEPGLNLQMFWTDEDGELQYGKRPLLNKKMLEFIRDNDVINKSIAIIESLEPEEETAE